MQIKTTMRNLYTPNRMAIICKIDKTKCWQGRDKIWPLIHCWWECKMYSHFGKVCQFLKIKHRLCHMETCSHKNMNMNVHSSITHNCLKLEAIHVYQWCMGRQKCGKSYNWIIFNNYIFEVHIHLTHIILKNMHVKEAKCKRKYTVWFHLYEISRKGKCRDSSCLGGWSRDWLQTDLRELSVDRSVIKLDFNDGCTTPYTY